MMVAWTREGEGRAKIRAKRAFEIVGGRTSLTGQGSSSGVVRSAPEVTILREAAAALPSGGLPLRQGLAVTTP